MTLVSATVAEFEAFLSERGLTVSGTTSVLVLRSFDFLETVEFCTEPDAEIVVKAQCFIAYAMDSNGGGFSPTSVAEKTNLIEKGLCSGAIVKKWQINSDLVGTDPKSLLKTVPAAYGLLKPSLCSGYGAFVV